MIDDEIRQFYEQGREQDRLALRIGTLELARTKELLARFLPPPPANVLDVGGGPGVHAAWLARIGYRVHLLEPVPRIQVAAATLALEGATLGELAARLGYGSDAAFARAFKRLGGVPPGAIRRAGDAVAIGW